MTNHFEVLQNKILDPSTLQRKLNIWRLAGKKVVFTNGCFDILHRGHVEYLAKAAGFADIMIVGLNTDASVQRLKGPSRPVQDQEARAIILAGLHFISAVVLFDEDTPYELIKTVQPNCLAKGADYKPEDIVGYDIVTQNGGEVRTVELVEGFSTTSTLAKLEAGNK